MKFPSRDLNSGSYPSHPINTYTCGVIIVSRVRGGCNMLTFNYWRSDNGNYFILFFSLFFFWVSENEINISKMLM